jgi:hypothetical protein
MSLQKTNSSRREVSQSVGVPNVNRLPSDNTLSKFTVVQQIMRETVVLSEKLKQ